MKKYVSCATRSRSRRRTRNLKIVVGVCEHAAHSDRHAAHRSLCLALMGECDALSDAGLRPACTPYLPAEVAAPSKSKSIAVHVAVVGGKDRDLVAMDLGLYSAPAVLLCRVVLLMDG